MFLLNWVFPYTEYSVVRAIHWHVFSVREEVCVPLSWRKLVWVGGGWWFRKERRKRRVSLFFCLVRKIPPWVGNQNGRGEMAFFSFTLLSSAGAPLMPVSHYRGSPQDPPSLCSNPRGIHRVSPIVWHRHKECDARGKGLNCSWEDGRGEFLKN